MNGQPDRALSPAPEAGSETYTSSDYEYPRAFDNTIICSIANHIRYVDAAYFGGQEIIFFTLFASAGGSDDDDKKLYYCVPALEQYGELNIGNSQVIDYRIRTAVLNNVLYIFYTSNTGATDKRIRYRTATVSYGSNGKDWKLSIHGESSISVTQSAATVLFAAVMNSQLYIIYSSNRDWYSISSADGLAFSPGARFFTTSDDPYGPAGAVFQVPDASEGCVERMMIAFITSGYTLSYFFFDGKSGYGPYSIPNDVTPSAYSVRLITGTAQGYTNTRYAIQVFIASPEGGSNQEWSSIYHREYTPAGPHGEAGSWSSTWSRLSSDKDDAVKSYNAFESDFGWSLIPFYSAEGSDVRMSLSIWYSKGVNYKWPSRDYAELRRSSYMSDLLCYDGRRTVGASEQELSTSTVLGVIEGTPPFPVNGGVPESESSQTSTVELAATSGYETATAWSVGGTVVASYGTKILSIGLSAKLSAGLKYTKDTRTSSSTSTKISLFNYTQDPHGDLGWVLVLKPEILNDGYLIKAYDRHAISYGGETSTDALRLSTIQYGPGSSVVTYAYRLDNPTSTYSYAAIFEGMAPRPLSTDIVAWQSVLQTDPSYKTLYQLPTVSGTLGEKGNITIVRTTADGSTYSPSASFSAEASKLGFTFGASVAFSMDIKTTTSMMYSLGFNYNLPQCKASTSCIAQIDIVPYILVANSDNTGYNAPWISQDIRNYRKPKPWCLSYRAYPGTCSAGNS